MTKIKYAFAAMAVSGLAGCSTHPLPEDFARDNTFEIVQKIRCETQLAVFEELNLLIDKSNLSRKFNDASSLSKEFRTFNEFLDYIYLNMTNPEKNQILKYTTSSMSYTFTLKMTENNKNSATGKFSLPLMPGAFSLGFDVGNNYMRQNERVIELGDKFPNLFTDRNLRNCNKRYVKFANKIYPITGSIGMREVIATFRRLNEEAGGADKFVDTLTFSTMINGKISPGATLTPPTQSFHLTSISGEFGSDRDDNHKVQLSLVAPNSEEVAALLARLRERNRPMVTRKPAQRVSRRRQSTSRRPIPRTRELLNNTLQRAKENAETERLREFRDKVDRLPD